MNLDIYTTLKGRILNLEYAPGSILNEKTIAEEFGVSRTPLRNVLNRLEFDQLIRVIPRTGILVAEIEFQKIMHTFQVRLGIEEMIGAFAAEHATEEHFARLVELQRQCEPLLTSKDKAALIGIDRGIKAVLNDSANNPVLGEISDSLYDHTVRLWSAVLDKGDWREEVQSVYNDIEQTLVSLQGDRAGLGKLRRALLVEHIERIRRKFLGQ